MEQLASIDISKPDPRFDQLNRWTSLMMQVFAAKAYLRFLGEYKSLEDFSSMDSILQHQGYFNCFLISYWKCFGEAKGKRKLEASAVFLSTPDILPIHDRIKALRHEAAAHNGQSGLDHSAIEVIEGTRSFEISQKYAIALPIHEYPDFERAVFRVDEYVADELNRCKDSLARSLGKPIEIKGANKKAEMATPRKPSD